MKPFRCVHCQANLRVIYDEVRKNAPKAETHFLLCPGCGEPLAIAGRGFRKLTAEEMEELVGQPAYHESVSSWKRQQLQAPETVEEMWQAYRTQVLHHATNPETIQVSRDIFISGFSMAMAYFKYIATMGSTQFSVRMNKMENELDAFKQETYERATHNKGTTH